MFCPKKNSYFDATSSRGEMVARLVLPVTGEGDLVQGGVRTYWQVCACDRESIRDFIILVFYTIQHNKETKQKVPPTWNIVTDGGREKNDRDPKGLVLLPLSSKLVEKIIPLVKTFLMFSFHWLLFVNYLLGSHLHGRLERLKTANNNKTLWLRVY